MRWDGERWRMWTLAGGVALILVSGAVAGVVAAIIAQAFLPLLLLFLVVEILVTSLVGSGFLDGMTSRLSRGGLTRESTDFVERIENEADLKAAEERNRQLKSKIAAPSVPVFSSCH
jgi:hypothetical protein